MFLVQLTVPSDVTWIKVNMQYVGYYRVNYEPDMWTKLGRLCSSKVRNFDGVISLNKVTLFHHKLRQGLETLSRP